jgi:hypothetical protein
MVNFYIWHHVAIFFVSKPNSNIIEEMDLSDKVYQLLAHGRWFSPASSTTKTGRHDIAEILLKVALKHQKSKIKSISSMMWNNRTLLFTIDVLSRLFLFINLVV